MISPNNPLYAKADKFATRAYEISGNFPRHELFGLTSQFRRAALSVVLNIVEGFARQSSNEFRRFLLISFGSLEECRYLINFAIKQRYLDTKDGDDLVSIMNEVAKITWTIIYKQKN